MLIAYDAQESFKEACKYGDTHSDKLLNMCLPARSWDGTLAIHHNLIDVKSQPRTASYSTWNQNWSKDTREE